METRDFAYFVERPRTIEDLLQPHLFEKEQEYRIVKTIELGKMDSRTCLQIVSLLRTVQRCAHKARSGNVS